MIIRNALIYTPEHSFREGTLAVRKERIVPEDVPLPGEEVVDAKGLYALPGLVDIHLHGAAGCDFCDAEASSLQTIADYEAAHGILAFCPAAMTVPVKRLEAVMETAAAYENGQGADLTGVRLEGPFLNPARAGAQDPACILKGDRDLFERLQSISGGKIKILDIAPEMEGNPGLIRDLHGKVRVSLAHTCADYDTAKAAFRAGASQLTHLFNAMPGIGHREPGPVLAGAEEGASAELICDGIHVHPAAVRLAFRLFGPGRIIMISDSMRAAGLADGVYDLGGQPVLVQGKKAVLAERPDTIAGSAANLYDCLKTAVLEMRIPLEDAVRAASENPAAALGISGDYGSLRCGACGNIILADKALNLKAVVKKGQFLQITEMKTIL